MRNIRQELCLDTENVRRGQSGRGRICIDDGPSHDSLLRPHIHADGQQEALKNSTTMWLLALSTKRNPLNHVERGCIAPFLLLCLVLVSWGSGEALKSYSSASPLKFDTKHEI